MATIHNVLLGISERQGRAFVEVSFRIDASDDDRVHKQSYRLLIELVGVDEGPGEDGRSELIPNGEILDETISFDVQSSFVRTVAKSIPSKILDEDPGPPARRDEIRARLSLIPTALSNVVHRGAQVIDPKA